MSINCPQINKFKYKLNYKYLMARTRFFFYDIELQVKEGRTFDLLSRFKEIQQEKQTNGVPSYVTIDNHRVCIMVNEIKEQNNEAFVLGKFVATEGRENYREENKGEFYDVELSDEDSQLCNLEKGALFFLVYIDTTTGKTVLMFEMVHFSIGIGGLRTYFKERYDELDYLITVQKLGRDLEPILERVANSGLRIARIKTNRDITEAQLRGKGPIEKAAKLLIDEDIDCELIFRFRKGEKTFFDFLKDVFHKEDVSDLLRTEFGDFFRKFDFVLDNTAEMKFNFFDKVLRYELPFSKIDSMNEERAIYENIYGYFIENKEDILGQ